MKNKELLKQWVIVLRSEKYKQGRGVLRTANDEFCCLGVLCDIVDNTGWSKTPDSGYTYKTLCTFPPLSIIGPLLSIEHMANLACMNDREKKSFNEIADYIERELIHEETT